MAHPAGKKEESRRRILAGAGRGFRRDGYGGLGVDGLARESGVTSGAFYAHFTSKAEAFREAALAGLEEVRRGVAGFRAEHGAAWLEKFAAFYTGERRRLPLAESCGLQSLTPEVARADVPTRAAFQAAFDVVVQEVAGGLEGDQARARAMAMLAMLVGGVSLARAMADETMAAEIAEAVRAEAVRLAQAPRASGDTTD